MSEWDASMNSSLAADNRDKRESFLVTEEKHPEKQLDEDSMERAKEYDYKTIESEVMEQSLGMRTKDHAGEVNMEAIINADDVMRAGGFGARDDLSSLLPVAIDSTDFEASLRDARDFEEPQGEILRPGLGWTESRDKE